jgi:hypothetical protein
VRWVVALLVATAAAAGCARYARPTSALPDGSCAGACEHYADCRGDGDDRLERDCLAECESIFVTDGEPDREALGEFEDLDCPDAIAFVEGDAGRRPGADRAR